MKFNFKILLIFLSVLLVLVNIGFSDTRWNFSINNSITDTITWGGHSEGTANSVAYGTAFYLNSGNKTLSNVAKISYSTATRVRLLNSTGTVLATSTFIGDNAVFNYALSNQSTYFVVFDSSGSNYENSQKTAPNTPITSTYVDYTTTCDLTGSTLTDYGGGAVNNLLSLSFLQENTKTYIYRVKINQSLLSPGTLFYIDGKNGTIINNIKLNILASSNTGNLSLYYNSATDYVIVENDTTIQTIPPNLLAYYKFDNTTGVSDYLGNANGTITGTVTSTSGMVVDGRYFNSGKSETADYAPMNIADKNFTINGWIKKGSSPLHAALTSDGEQTFAMQFAFGGADDALYFYADLGADSWGCAVIYMGQSDTSYHMYTVTRNNANISVYVDGSYVASSNTCSGTIAHVDGTWTFGKSQTSYSDKNLDEFSFWNTALNSSQIYGMFYNTAYETVTGYGNTYGFESNVYNSYNNHLRINISEFTSQSLFYVNGTNGVNINGNKIFILATAPVYNNDANLGHGQADDGGGSIDWWQGVGINTTKDYVYVTGITKFSAANPTTCFLFNGTNTTRDYLINGTFSGDTCLLSTPYLIKKNTNYYFLTGSVGHASYTQRYKAVYNTWPIVGNHITIISEADDGADPSAETIRLSTNINNWVSVLTTEKPAGNVSLYYNNATDYVVVENDTYVQSNLNSAYHYYKADELTTGNMTDYLGRAHLTEAGGTTANQTGKINGARGTFNGNVELSTAFYPFNYNTNFSVSMWVYMLATNPENEVWYTNDGNSDTEFLHQVYVNGADIQFQVGKWAIGVNNCLYTGGLISGNWYHLASSFNGTHISCYVNNVSQTPTAYSYGALASTNKFRLGNAAEQTTEGQDADSIYVDELVVFNKTLSASDVNSIFKNYNFTLPGYGDVYAYDDPPTPPIPPSELAITSINITAQYTNYDNTIDYTYWNSNNLTCQAIASGAEPFDNISYSWYKNNNLILENLTLLSIGNYSVNDNISCQATAYNGTSNAISSRNITILGSLLNNVTMTQGSLYCAYNGTAINNATIQWKANGTEIYNDTLFGDNNISQLNDSYLSSLYTYSCSVYSYPIQNVTWSVFDSYNNITNTSLSGMINNINLTPVPAYWDTQNLTCNADLNYTNNVSYEWYINGVGGLVSYEYFIFIEADFINTTEFIIPSDGINIETRGTGYIIYSTTGTLEEQRAKIIKLLFFGTNGTNQRAISPYVENISVLSTNYANDVNSMAYYVYAWQNNPWPQGKVLYIEGNFSNNISNYNVSMWYNLSLYPPGGCGGDPCGNYIQTEMPLGNITGYLQMRLANRVYMENSTFGNDTLIYNRDNPSTTFITSVVSDFVAQPAIAKVIYLTKESINWTWWKSSAGGSFDVQFYNYTQNYNVPIFTLFNNNNMNYLNNSNYQTYDNVSCKIKTYSGFIYDEANVNTTILGSLLNTVTILNNSGYVYNTSLICNYTGEHINNTIINWYKNNIFVSNSINLEAQYYDNSSIYNCTVYSYPYQNDSWSILSSNQISGLQGPIINNVIFVPSSYTLKLRPDYFSDDGSWISRTTIYDGNYGTGSCGASTMATATYTFNYTRNSNSGDSKIMIINSDPVTIETIYTNYTIPNECLLEKNITIEAKCDLHFEYLFANYTCLTNTGDKILLNTTNGLIGWTQFHKDISFYEASPNSFYWDTQNLTCSADVDYSINYNYSWYNNNILITDVIKNSAVLYYDFNDNSSNKIIDYFNRYNQTIIGNINFTEGISGKAFYFDGATSSESSAYANNLGIDGGNNFTINMWFKADNCNDIKSIFHVGDNTIPGTNSLKIITPKSDGGCFINLDYWYGGLVTVTPIELNVWNMLTFVYRDNAQQTEMSEVWINGILNNNGTIISSLIPSLKKNTQNTIPLKLANGQFPGTKAFYDEFGVWNYSMTPSEIYSLFSLSLYTNSNNTLNNSYYQTYDNISCKVTAFAGGMNVSENISTTILGSKLNTVTILNNSGYVYNTSLICNYTGEHINNTIINWYKNNIFVSNSINLEAQYYDNTSIYNCTVYSYPYQNDSWSILSSNQISGLQGPMIENLILTPAYWDTQNLTCSADVNYSNNYNYSWYKNDNLILENNSILDISYYQTYDNISCKVTAFAGSMNVSENITTTILGSKINSVILDQGFVDNPLICNYSGENINNVSVEWYNKNSTTFCYQETANISTSCGGTNTGIYEVVPYYLYVNYTKPLTSNNNSVWQVKHSNLNIYNVSIDNICWNTFIDKISLRFYSAYGGGGGTSYGECYNGTAWKIITEISSGYPWGGYIGGGDNAQHAIDGNWNTVSYYNFDYTWLDLTPDPYLNNPKKAAIWEEAMIWNISGGNIYNEALIGNNNQSILPVQYVENNNEYYCKVTSYPFQNNSWSIMYSNNVTILNMIDYVNIKPDVAYINDTLLCNVSTLYTSSFNTSWYKNNVIILENSSTISSGMFNIFDNMSCELTTYNSTYIQKQNSSVVTISVLPMVINEIDITPQYPRTDEQIDCIFNVSTAQPNVNLSVGITWYKANDDGIFTNINTYDYLYENVNFNQLYTTGFGTGSTTGFNNYTNWKCEINVSNNITNILQNSSVRNVYPLENLTIILPTDNTYSNQILNVTITVIDKDEGIICNLTVNDTIVNGTTLLSGTNGSLYNDLINNGQYYYNVSCIANGNPTALFSNTQTYYYNILGTTYSNNVTNEGFFFPEIGDTIILNITAVNLYEIKNCSLLINDTGLFLPIVNLTIDTFYEYNLSANYTIPIYDTAENRYVYWKYGCYDNSGNYNESPISIFTVKDITNPVIVQGTGNNFGTNNITIINSFKNNLTYNITFGDNNLFQAEINVSCEINGTIHFVQDLNITTTILNLYNSSINLGQYQMQKCNIFFAASDDHTAQKIENYDEVKKDNMITFDTGSNIVDIISNDEDVKSIKTKKLIDRKTFEFNYDNKQLTRSYTVHSDNKLYYRESSKYKAHFVSWNQETHNGNWIDFETEGTDKIYTIEQVDEYTYNVIIEPKLPKDDNIKIEKKGLFGIIGEERTMDEQKVNDYGIENIKFSSIGGLNTYNESYDFYIGGQVNISSNNQFDNSNFSNYTLRIITLNAYPTFDRSYNITGYTEIAENFTNGTYLYVFDHPHYVASNITVIIENNSQKVLYNTSQAIINLIPQTWFGNNLANYTFTFSFSDLGSNVSINQSNNNISVVIPINASNYTYTITSVNYLTYTSTINLNYKDNITLSPYMGFIANFTIFDEITNQPFNMADAQKAALIIYCPAQNIIINISTSAFLVPVDCQYDKFQIQMFFATTGTTPIYRTYIIEPDLLNNVKLFFANGQTTPLVYIVFQVSDTLSQYPAAGLYIHRYINTTDAIITSDFTDIENKVGAYLVQNIYYQVDLYSNGRFVKSLGQYDADVSGTKQLTLFSVTMAPPIPGTEAIAYYINNQTVLGNNTIVAVYNDPSNLTDFITFTVREGTDGGPVVNQQTLPLVSNAQFVYDISNYSNTTLYTTLTYSYLGVYTTYQKSTIIGKPRFYIENPFTEIFGAGVASVIMNLVILIVLVIFSIYATVSNSKEISLIISIIATFFVIINWFSISSAVLSFVVIVNIISMLKKGNKAADVM